jgi:hypothetical protein
MRPLRSTLQVATLFDDVSARYSGYYAARQRRAIAVTRNVPVPNDATTLIVSVERWPDIARNLASILRWQAT